MDRISDAEIVEILALDEANRKIGSILNYCEMREAAPKMTAIIRQQAEELRRYREEPSEELVKAVAWAIAYHTGMGKTPDEVARAAIRAMQQAIDTN
jgi:hypothetical protein